MEIYNKHALKDLNTFGVTARTKFYTEIHDIDHIKELIEWKEKNDCPFLILGGGSNLLFKRDFDGMTAKVCLAGKEISKEDEKFTYVSVAAGENWHEFVRWTVEQGIAGLENLSYIPGTVGAAPIQNIGAYGVEFADHFHSLQAVNLDNGDILEFDKERCQFAYRESFFKAHALDKLLITSVTFALPKEPEWKIEYAGVKEALEGKKLSALLISNAIIKIRQSKLPNPDDIGNAGSFFKNPVLSLSDWKTLRETHEELTAYEQEDGSMKTSAAWLIDQCGWKGFRQGDAGISDKHALVLVNYGQATGEELWSIAQDIISSVEKAFGIRLEPEPRVIDSLLGQPPSTPKQINK